MGEVHSHDKASRWIGRVLQDKWTIEAKIGHGGVATVFRATHRQGQVAAIKIMHPEYARNEDVRRRFLREGYAANKVGHRGVVRVLDDDVTPDGSAYIVMELLDRGEVLEDRRERLGGRIPVTDVADICDQVLDVLAAAHEQGIIHRDIKPENIFVLSDGTVKVLDFGIAHIKEAAQKENTATGLLLGTPEYMSPEQALGTRGRIDAQTDIYAVGATMFTLLSGEAVHVHDALSALLVAAASRQARSLASVAFKELPRELIAVVDRALALEKPRRWPSARAMQLALRDAVPGSARMLAMAEAERKGDTTSVQMMGPPQVKAITAETARAIEPAKMKAAEAAAKIAEPAKTAEPKPAADPARKPSLPPIVPPSRSQSAWPPAAPAAPTAPTQRTAPPRAPVPLPSSRPGPLPKPSVAKRHSAPPPPPPPSVEPPATESSPPSFATVVNLPPAPSRPASDAPSSGPTAVIHVPVMPRPAGLSEVDDAAVDSDSVDSNRPTETGLKAAPRAATKSNPWTDDLAPGDDLDGPTTSIMGPVPSEPPVNTQKLPRTGSNPVLPPMESIARPALPSRHPDGEFTRPLTREDVAQHAPLMVSTQPAFVPKAAQNLATPQNMPSYAPPPPHDLRPSYVPPGPLAASWQTPRTGFPPPMQQAGPQARRPEPSPIIVVAAVAAAVIVLGLWVGGCLLIRGF